LNQKYIQRTSLGTVKFINLNGLMKEYLSEKTEKVKQNDCIYPEAKAGRFFFYVF
jgi:hypothetical protein